MKQPLTEGLGSAFLHRHGTFNSPATGKYVQTSQILSHE
jgi:hypothetical protein